MDKLREADAIVDALGKAMQSGEAGLRVVPALIVRVIDEDLWRARVIAKTGQQVGFETFREFVETAPLDGLGADIPIIKRLCCGDQVAIDAIDRVTKGRQGARTDLLYNIQEVKDRAPTGTSTARALRKLRNQAPTLHQRVLAGELSPHAAMVEAGFRKKTMTIPTNVDGIARALKRRLTADEIAELLDLL